MIPLGLSTLQKVALAGVVIALYALWVEWSYDVNFKPLCDISEKWSCSKVLTSRESHLIREYFNLPNGHWLDIPNAGLGLLFYCLALIYDWWPITEMPYRHYILFCSSVLALTTSLYLAVLLFYVMGDFCIVCISSYVVTVSIFILSIKEIADPTPPPNLDDDSDKFKAV